MSNPTSAFFKESQKIFKAVEKYKDYDNLRNVIIEMANVDGWQERAEEIADKVIERLNKNESIGMGNKTGQAWDPKASYKRLFETINGERV